MDKNYSAIAGHCLYLLCSALLVHLSSLLIATGTTNIHHRTSSFTELRTRRHLARPTRFKGRQQRATKIDQVSGIPKQQQIMSNNGYTPPIEDGGSIPPSAATDESMMTVAIRYQDSMIDELAVGVSRLRDQSYFIGEESRMHTNLLNDMESNLDAAHEGLGNETRRASRLRGEGGSIWRLQLTVAGLSILFVFLVFLRFI
jgi:hypothetical protein